MAIGRCPRRRLSAQGVVSPDPSLNRRPKSFIDGLASQEESRSTELSIADAREVLEGIQRQPIQKLPAQEEDITIPGGPCGKISIRIIRPANSTGGVPVVMYFHGGGWILGSKNTHGRLVREIANGVVLECLCSRRRDKKRDYRFSARGILLRNSRSFLQPLLSPMRMTYFEMRAELISRRLIQAGVRVTATRYLGTHHDFMMLNALASTPAVRAAVAQANNMLMQAFGIVNPECALPRDSM